MIQIVEFKEDGKTYFGLIDDYCEFMGRWRIASPAKVGKGEYCIFHQMVKPGDIKLVLEIWDFDKYNYPMSLELMS